MRAPLTNRVRPSSANHPRAAAATITNANAGQRSARRSGKHVVPSPKAENNAATATRARRKHQANSRHASEKESVKKNHRLSNDASISAQATHAVSQIATFSNHERWRWNGAPTMTMPLIPWLSTDLVQESRTHSVHGVRLSPAHDRRRLRLGRRFDSIATD